MKLKLRSVEFEYPSISVLKNISFELNSQETLAIVGKNGAGKSTLIKCINRILEYEKGKILLDEQEVAKMKRKDIAKRIAYLPQKSSYTFPIVVFDVVLMGRYPHLSGGNNKENEKRVWEILKILNLESLALRNFGEISAGQQQKVLIARAIVQEADLLLFDEPTSNLDLRHQLEVMEIIKKIVREKSISAIVAIHDLNLAARYSDNAIMLNNGVIFALGTPFSVFTSENIAEVYGVEALVTEKEGIPNIIPQRPI
ncbi:MAG: ABC transporter ATP-binding protein [Candidatus Theseobacter exili]|nr:ABC transporter ATP-binding protein [Candidatus Theseobacter exili]